MYDVLDASPETPPRELDTLPPPTQTVDGTAGPGESTL